MEGIKNAPNIETNGPQLFEKTAIKHGFEKGQQSRLRNFIMDYLKAFGELSLSGTVTVTQPGRFDEALKKILSEVQARSKTSSEGNPGSQQNASTI